MSQAININREAGANGMNSTPIAVTPLSKLGADSAMVECPYCHHYTMTKIQKEDTGTAM